MSPEIDPRLRAPRWAGGIIWVDGQMFVWDADPPEDFGQVWIPVCLRCGNGPLDANGRALCEVCEPPAVPTDEQVWTAVRHAAWVSAGRMPF